MERARRATTAAKTAASIAQRRAEEAAKAARAQTRAAVGEITEELGGPRQSIEEAMRKYITPGVPARPGSERARYEAIMGKPYPGFEPGAADGDDAMGRGRRRKTRKGGRRKKASRKTRRRA